MSKQNLTNTEVDILREIGNIGAGNATTALSVLLGSRLQMGIPIVRMVEFDELSELLGGADVVVSAVLTHFTGGVRGMTLFILEREEAKSLVEVMLGKTFGDDFVDFDAMEKSALKEIGNILMSSYISSIGTLTNLELRTEPPAFCSDMAGSVLSLPISELGQIGDQALIIDSQITDNNNPINGLLMFVTDEESYENIFKSLGIGC